ncbi:unnamed protein product [Adineta ricciae]|uniref:Uncharacterized protein n=1 Tax=Adineta ricciae TaxID=249248 RepID=A0A815K671_ADIRI|nr:unnamed protein product [Adineta ricciae]
MLKLCIYRQKYIDNLLQQLMDFFPYRLIIQNDSGSKDPESDYDIRIGSTDGSDADIDACMIFNEFFSQHWSLPSGIVFDTNLYPRHLNTVEPIFNVQGTGLGIFRTIRCDYPYYFFTEINDYKQNKMSMIKLRKSMTGKEWQDYINRITKADSSLREFFYRADTTYWKYTKKLLTQISKPNKLIRDTLNEIANIVPTIKTDRYDTTRFEYLWSKVHGRMRPALMEHSSILFISYLRQARNLEREIRNRKDRYDNSFLHPILCIPPNEMAYIDALTVSMRHKFSKAIYFANDACVAEGSMYYVSVEQYNNHVDVSYVKDKTLRTNLLTNNQLYQSMNEQYGNFLKYIKSYSNKQVHNGRTIYRSSKYLYRLVNTMIDLGANQWNRMGFDNDQHGKRLGLLVKECLLFIRKYKYPYNEMNSNDRAEISEYFALGIFPTDRQLQIFWEYRRSTLDRSSELYKYRSYTWESMRKPPFQSKIQDLLIEDIRNKKFDGISSLKQTNCSILDQFTSAVYQLVIDSHDKIYYSYFRGIFDNISGIIRYIFDWKITRFNIVIKYTRHDEYSQVKRLKADNSITLKNYIIGILFGLRLACFRMFIIAPFMFLIEPIQKSVWILKTLLNIEQPYDRILLYTRAEYATLTTGNISVVHDSRIVDTGVTISDAYGTNRQISNIIGVLRLLATFMIQGIVWFSWIIVITDVASVFTESISLESMYIMQRLYIICLSCVFVIISVLNTWTTIRRYLLLDTCENAQYLATVRANQGTRANYLSILAYITIGVIFNITFTVFELERAQWFHITPFAIIFDSQPVHLTSIQLVILIIAQGMAIALIDVIDRSALGKERLPDDELSNRNMIGRKEWLNFPVGTICSLLRFKNDKRKTD